MKVSLDHISTDLGVNSGFINISLFVSSVGDYLLGLQDFGDCGVPQHLSQSKANVIARKKTVIFSHGPFSE